MIVVRSIDSPNKTPADLDNIYSARYVIYEKGHSKDTFKMHPISDNEHHETEVLGWDHEEDIDVPPAKVRNVVVVSGPRCLRRRLPPFIIRMKT